MINRLTQLRFNGPLDTVWVISEMFFSQSLTSVLKKLNLTQQKQTNASNPKDTTTQV